MVNTTDTAVRVHVKIATDQQNSNLAQQLSIYLSNKGIDVTLYPLSTVLKGELEYPNYQWLVFVLSSVAKSANLIEIVDSSRDLVAHRRLQGVLAITDSSLTNQVASLWPTLRIYDVDTQNEEAMNEAFGKIYRTLSYTRVPVSTSRGDGQMAALPTQAPPRPIRSRLVIGGVIFAAFLIVAFCLFGPLDLFSRFSPAPTRVSSFTPTPGHPLTQTAATPSPTGDPTTTTPLDPQALFNSTTKPKPTMNYPLIVSDISSTTDWQNADSCTFTPSGYNIRATTQGQYAPCMLQNKTYTDFAFQVNMHIFAGGAGGLIFRSNSHMSVFYRFSVDTGGNYVLLVCTECTTYDNLNATKLAGNTLPKASSQYTIAVIAIKNFIYLYINGLFLTQVTDSTSSSGSIGLYAASETQPTTAVFTAAKVWKL